MISFPHATSCILRRHHSLALNRIISLPLKLPRSLLVPSHYVASLSLLFFINHDTTHTMDDMTLTPEVVQTLFNTIRELRTEVAELKASQTATLTSSQDDNTNPPPVSKSEKF